MNLSFTFSYKFWTCELWWSSKYYINFIFSLFTCFVIPQASRSPLEHKKRRKVPELIPLSLFYFYNLIVGGGGIRTRYFRWEHGCQPVELEGSWLSPAIHISIFNYLLIYLNIFLFFEEGRRLRKIMITIGTIEQNASLWIT